MFLQNALEAVTSALGVVRLPCVLSMPAPMATLPIAMATALVCNWSSSGLKLWWPLKLGDKSMLLCCVWHVVYCVCVACWSTVVGLSTYTCSWCTTPSKCSAGSCPNGYGLASDGSCSGECILHEILKSLRHSFFKKSMRYYCVVAYSVWR